MSTLRARSFFRLLLFACLPLISGQPGHAVESVQFSLGSLEGNGWSLSDARVQLELNDKGKDRLYLTASSASLPARMGALSDIVLDCPNIELTGVLIRCLEGRLNLRSSDAGNQQLSIDFEYRRADGRIQATLRRVRYLGGRHTVWLKSGEDGWQLRLAGNNLALSSVLKRLQQYAGNIPSIDAEGRVDLTASLHGNSTTLAAVRTDLSVRDATFSDDSGRYAGEGIGLQLGIRARPRAGNWHTELTTSLLQGALYVDPVYLEAGEDPVHAEATMLWQPEGKRLSVQTFSYEHPDSLRVAANGVFEFSSSSPVHQLHVQLRDVRFPTSYTTYIQPWFTGTLGDRMETAGRLEAEFEVHKGELRSASATLDSVDIGETGGLFGFAGLEGRLNWNSSEKPVESWLQWIGGHIYAVELGGSRIDIESVGNSLELQQAAHIPVLDGGINIESFSLTYDENLRWDVDGILTPVSMKRLTRAIGWQEFNGKLSGMIPSVQYVDGVLSIGGELRVRVFDGVVTMSDLRVEQPLGLVPRLQVNALFDDIDLDTLTGTFSFGRIEGRLDGRIDNLLLESWRPVAFDAEFATPEDDDSRHRISQQAVDSISSIGGGVGGALSRSYLQFFEDFPYDRLGIRCKLRNGVCDMSGVAPAENGYYLVKGRFLPPRLDVVGYANRVDWDSLVAQIIAVTREKAAVVK